MEFDQLSIICPTLVDYPHQKNNGLRVAVPFPCKVKRKRGNVYANVTLIVFRDVTLTKAK